MPTDTIAMDFPFQQTSELMRVRTSHRGTWMPYPATARITRDGEVPFIRYAAKVFMKFLVMLVYGLLSVSNGAIAEVQKPGISLMALERDIDHCACFVYLGETAKKENLILMTDELGEDATQAWINLGNGDVELKKLSYHETDKVITFAFEKNGTWVSFTGKVISPSSESQEYHILSGKLLVRHGSKSKELNVLVHSGC
jgi:hypothetical protein